MFPWRRATTDDDFIDEQRLVTENQGAGLARQRTRTQRLFAKKQREVAHYRAATESSDVFDLGH